MYGWESVLKIKTINFRIDDLRETDAHIKFLSLEPLIGELRNLDLTDIDWVIVGGESGRLGRDLCRKSG